MIKKPWGVSAVGSAQRWQRWGQGFESPTLQFFIVFLFLMALKILPIL